ncbi:MAG: hypothetical protein N0E48_00615, partial [Candidatus Thiodiazotropha endolucinida]|nr:hypothetical protein [Candidatus Thiodiazotropha taylori]MCW4341869.1 hypothetical protein [Candidatus Thiodiazotropha endolucinida]
SESDLDDAQVVRKQKKHKKKSKKGDNSDDESAKRKIKKKSKNRVETDTSSEESDTELDSSDDMSRKKKRRPALRSAPKLTFDGKGDWDVFEEKFQDYAEQMDWTPRECKSCLKWCLQGKASKFLKSLLKTNKDISYKKMLKKLGDRFGDDDISTAVYARFNRAIQKKNESVEDWADRVQELAAKAFNTLPDEYCRSMAVDRFCQGMLDCEAGHNVNLQAPKTLEDAVKQVRLFQHIKESCYEKRRGRGRDVGVTAEDYNEVPEVCAVPEQSEMKALISEMAEQRKILEKLLVRDHPQQPPVQSTSEAQGRDPKREGRACFFCHRKGHVRRNCKKCQEELNKTGTSQGAMARTQKEEGPGKGQQ